MQKRVGDLSHRPSTCSGPTARSTFRSRAATPAQTANLNTADDGGLVTIYDYDPAYRGAAFVGNQATNRPEGRSDYFNSYEASVTRRLTGQLVAAGRIYRDEISQVDRQRGVPTSPNDEFFPLDEAWRWNLKLNGNYNLPHDFLVGAIMEVVNGALGQRTYVFRATDASGPPLRQLASATIRLEPFGAQQEPQQTTFNARVGKKLTLGKRSLNLSFDVLNVMNSNAITAVTYVSGPSFGRVTDILPPRTLRSGGDL